MNVNVSRQEGAVRSEWDVRKWKSKVDRKVKCVRSEYMEE